MRVVHLADTHLGHRYLTKSDESGRNVRELDIYQAFEAAIEKIIELRPDAVLHAGDLFDSFHPSTQAIAIALDGFRRLHEAEIPAIVVSGNHSTPRYRATQHVFSLLSRFGGVDAVWEAPQRIRVGDLAITAIPHQHDAESFEATVRDAAPLAEARFNVLLLHAGIDLLPRVGAGEAGAIELGSELLEEVADFNYIALGHFHMYQPLRVNACYSGSLERLSFNDRAAEKVILEVDLAAGPADADWISRHPVPTRLVRDLEEIDGHSTTDLTAEVLSRLGEVHTQGAVLRCPIRRVTQETYRSLDMEAIQQASAGALHFELKPEFAGAGLAKPRTAEDLQAYVIAATEEGFDVDEVMRRAERFLSEAGSGLEQ